MLGLNETSRPRTSIVLGPHDRLEGHLYVEGDLTVAGTVVGSLEASGDVEIAGGGKVRGPVATRNRLVVGPQASLEGDVQVGRIVIQDGAAFSGKVSMVKPGQTLNRAAMDAQVAAAVAAPEPVKAATQEAAATPANGSSTTVAARAPETTKGKPDSNPGKSPDAKGKPDSNPGKSPDAKGKRR
ncbi:MAG: polymer-forming cytoskeletal protein [Candidatus Dormibacterales bacterium]